MVVLSLLLCAGTSAHAAAPAGAAPAHATPADPARAIPVAAVEPSRPSTSPAAQGRIDPAPALGLPDVTRGERYDGRAQRRSARRLWLAAPRALLYVPRTFLLGLGIPLRATMEWLEREKVIEHLYATFTSADGLIGVRPVFTFESHFKPSFGLSYFDGRMFPGGRLEVAAAIGGPDVIAATAKLTTPPLGSDRHGRFEIETRYYRSSDELFTGIGTNLGQRSRYAVDRVDLAAGFTLTPARWASVRLGIDLGLRRFGDGIFYDDRPISEVYCVRGFAGRCRGLGAGAVDEALVPGFHAGTQFLRESLLVHLDSRDGDARPRGGAGLDFGLTYTHGIGTDSSSYLRWTASGGASVAFYRHHALYLRLSAVDEVTLGGNQSIPFSELVLLGGPDDLRGFRRGLFRDQSSVLGSAEYRWPIWMWMDASLFADYGGVFGSNFGAFSWDRMHPGIGAGIRVRTRDKFVLRVQFAYGFGNGGETLLVVSGNAELARPPS